MIESSLSSVKTGTRSIVFSGNLQNTMKESMNIAYSYARSFLSKIGNDFLEK